MLFKNSPKFPYFRFFQIFAAYVALFCVPHASADDSWLAFRGDTARTGYSKRERTLKPPLATSWVAIRGAAQLADANVIIEASPLIADGRVYIATIYDAEYSSGFDSSIVCLDFQTGEVLWKTQLGTDGIWATPVLDGYGKLFAAAWDGKVYALNANNGSILWQKQLAPIGERAFRAAPIIYRNILYIASYIYGGQGKLFALSPTTGALFTEINLPGSVYASPSIGGNKIFLAVQLPGGLNTEIQAYSILPSTLLKFAWSRSVNNDFGASTPIYVKGKILHRSGTYSSPNFNRLHVIKANSGEPLHSPFYLPNDGYYYSSPAASSKLLYVATKSKLYALDLRKVLQTSNGPLPVKWTFTPAAHGDEGQLASSPAIANGMLYLSTDDLSAADGSFFAVDAVTGSLQWNYRGPNGDGIGSAQASPAIADGAVVFVSYDDNNRLDHGVYKFTPAD